METLLLSLQEGHLTPEQAHLVTWNALPKLTLSLLKMRLPSAPAVCDRLNEYLRAVLSTTVRMLQTCERYELVECTSRILSDAASYPLYTPPGGGRGGRGDVDSNSSDGGSASYG